MSAVEHVDGTAEEIGTELAAPAAQSAGLAVASNVTAADLVQRLGVIRDAMNTAMQVDVDYGKIPGVNKPTLLKPGAEKLGVLFQLDIQLVNEQTWGPGDHLTVTSRATVFHSPTGTRLGTGEGMCSTRESKYGKRQGQRVCPECEKPAIIKGKAEYGGGWVCFKKKDGCGAKFPDDDQRVTGQQTGTVENPDIPDTWNTVLKMAEKRARVDAVLAVTGASALFTQDAEDIAAPTSHAAPSPAQPAAPRWESAGITEPQYRQIESLYVKLGAPQARMIALLDKVGAKPATDIPTRLLSLDGHAALKVQKALTKALGEMPEPEPLS